MAMLGAFCAVQADLSRGAEEAARRKERRAFSDAALSGGAGLAYWWTSAMAEAAVIGEKVGRGCCLILCH